MSKPSKLEPALVAMAHPPGPRRPLPDVVHVMYKGRIIKTGGPDFALELEQKGYEWLTGEAEDEGAGAITPVPLV